MFTAVTLAGPLQWVTDPVGSLENVMLDGVANAWKSVATFICQSTGMSDQMWSLAGDATNKIATLMLVIVIAITVPVLIRQAWDGEVGQMLWTAGRALLAWPLTFAVLWCETKISDAATQVTAKVMGTGLKIPDLSGDFGPIKNMLGVSAMIVFLLGMILCTIIMFISMAVRDFLLILAASLTGVAVMCWGMGSVGKGLAQRWLSWTLGLVLYQPLLALLIWLSASLYAGLSGGMKTFLGLGSVIVCSIAPWVLITKVNSWVGNRGLADAGQGSATATKTAASLAGAALTMGGGAVIGAGKGLLAAAAKGGAAVKAGGGKASGGIAAAFGKNPKPKPTSGEDGAIASAHGTQSAPKPARQQENQTNARAMNGKRLMGVGSIMQQAGNALQNLSPLGRATAPITNSVSTPSWEGQSPTFGDLAFRHSKKSSSTSSFQSAFATSQPVRTSASTAGTTRASMVGNTWRPTSSSSTAGTSTSSAAFNQNSTRAPRGSSSATTRVFPSTGRDGTGMAGGNSTAQMLSFDNPGTASNASVPEGKKSQAFDTRDETPKVHAEAGSAADQDQGDGPALTARQAGKAVPHSNAFRRK